MRPKLEWCSNRPPRFATAEVTTDSKEEVEATAEDVGVEATVASEGWSSECSNKGDPVVLLSNLEGLCDTRKQAEWTVGSIPVQRC